MTERAAKSTLLPIMCIRKSPSFFSSIWREGGRERERGREGGREGGREKGGEKEKWKEELLPH